MATGGITIENLPKELPLDFIKKITDNFSEERLIGTGAFGSVYTGKLDNGEFIAVKKLAENSQIFANEVQNIMVLEHENIVKMLAYCREADITAEITETVLCYEYLPMGNLDKQLFGDSSIIDWCTRFKVIMGICEGIRYLHTLPMPVLHLVLKPQNILLDDKMTPKITDFGFSRIFGEELTRMNTIRVVGSVGYMAPEYLYRGEISARTDIYSLGLIILEICTREKNSSSTEPKHARRYIDEVRYNWTLEQIMSEYPDLEEHDLDQIAGCIKIGLQCVEIDQDKRPYINRIIDMLNELPANYE